MLLVKTYIAPSAIHGMGLFAAEDIKKGDTIWKLEKNLDLLITKEKLATFPETARNYILHYAHLSSKNGCYTLSFDNDRFINDSENPNTIDVDFDGEEEFRTVAKRDIKKGEEITCSYIAFSDATDVSQKFKSD